MSQGDHRPPIAKHHDEAQKLAKQAFGKLFHAPEKHNGKEVKLDCHAISAYNRMCNYPKSSAETKTGVILKDDKFIAAVPTRYRGDPSKYDLGDVIKITFTPNGCKTAREVMVAVADEGSLVNKVSKKHPERIYKAVDITVGALHALGMQEFISRKKGHHGEIAGIGPDDHGKLSITKVAHVGRSAGALEAAALHCKEWSLGNKNKALAGLAQLDVGHSPDHRPNKMLAAKKQEASIIKA